MMNLTQISSAVNGQMVGVDVMLNGITTDTRADCTDLLFVALKGENFDAHDFVQSAVDHGAMIVGSIALLDRSFGRARSAYELQKKRNFGQYTGWLESVFKLGDFVTKDQLAEEKRYYDAWQIEQKQNECV